VSAGLLRPGARLLTVTTAAAAVAGTATATAAAAAQAVARGALAPRRIARRMLGSFGWPGTQFRYLDSLWDEESSWNVYAENPFSGAYGIPQAVPGGKMAAAGPAWRTSAATQIRWGLRYIKEVYGSPAAAWNHEVAYGWY
jgi:hypothetical protein